MTFGLVDVGYSLPEGQAVTKIYQHPAFFAPCFLCTLLKYVSRIFLALYGCYGHSVVFQCSHQAVGLWDSRKKI